ncbi:Homocysteine S-methyltransferase [Trametes gibbosa]|nr:Homocysteine S-methyltransferase [Trametes gibbosa]
MENCAKKAQVLILDGGLGTTLEDDFHQDISHALWSAKPIDENPEVIISAHLAFLRAGANVILTSTYQCAYNTFERAGYSRQDAVRTMRKSVALAREAKRRFLEEPHASDHGNSLPPREVKIALSLGPYGATLFPAQEFDGFYPPPYGPVLSDTGERTNTFADTPEGRVHEDAAIDALAAFHHERLHAFADDEETWKFIDFVAFETVPLRREIYAIRRAVTQLTNGGLGNTGLQMKPWWITTDYPDGHFPEMKLGGGHLTTADVAQAALVEDRGAVAWGFGINCTGLEFLPVLLKEVHSAAKEHWEKYGERPWLILYPNRGDVYDPETQSWHQTEKDGQGWAVGLGGVVLENVCCGCWEGVVAGGCCKTGPTEIAALTKELL